jgi:hypothetical protein
VNAATDLHPDNPEVAQAVIDAWTEVGVLAGNTDAEPATGPERAAARTVAISRSGGFAGITRTANVDLDSEDGQRIRGLLDQVDFAGVAHSTPQPDRFVYKLTYGDQELTVGETDLPPEVDEAIRIAFRKPAAGQNPSPGRQGARDVSNRATGNGPAGSGRGVGR